MQKKQTSVLTIVITILAAALGSWLAQTFLISKPTFDKQLMTMASEMNKNLPMMIDSETRLDNTIGGPGNTFTYN